MQINTRTACTTTRRTVVKRGKEEAVWSSSNTSSTASRPRSPTTRRRPTCSYYSLLSAVSSTRAGATSPQRLWSTWRTGWQGSEAPSRDCNTREARSRLLWTLDQLLSHQRCLEHQPQPLGETRSFQSRCTRAFARSRSTGQTSSTLTSSTSSHPQVEQPLHTSQLVQRQPRGGRRLAQPVHGRGTCLRSWGGRPQPHLQLLFLRGDLATIQDREDNPLSLRRVLMSPSRSWSDKSYLVLQRVPWGDRQLRVQGRRSHCRYFRGHSSRNSETTEFLLFNIFLAWVPSLH